MSHGFARHGLAVTPPSGAGGAWVRPSDWLALTTPDISEQKIVGLHAVLPGNNWVAFTLSGAYTVDWGDGTTENFAAGVTAYRNLAWSSYDTSTLTTRGYRQAIITITPQSGHNITSWNFFVKHNQPGLASGYSTGWLDMRLCTPHVTSATFSGGSGVIYHRMVEKFEQVGASSLTNLGDFFKSCTSLQSASLPTSTATSCASMFAGCGLLREINLNVPSATTLSFAFVECVSLRSAVINSPSVIDVSYAFYTCSSLTTVSLNCSAVTNTAYLFTPSPLQSVILTGLTRGVSVANASLSSTALDALYTSLGTAAGSQTITVSGNYGTTGDDPSIATAKGFTVSGS